MAQETQVLVVGGGPAGLAAAIAARKKGLCVTVADSAKPPIDKACGEGLLPATLAALRQLGIRIESPDGRSFRGIRFLDENTSVDAQFLGEPGIGVRRTVLHQKMADHAAACGVELHWNARVTNVSQEGAVVDRKQIRAKWIIGADGIHSQVRRWMGQQSSPPSEVRFARRRHYRVAPWTDHVEVYWGRGIQAYVTPLAGEETCVVLISRDARIRFEDALREFPKLESSLQNAELASAQRGAVTAMLQLERVWQRNMALIGDASGCVDAITGEGLGLSFRQALALADALERGELEQYQLAHQRLARRPTRMARLLLLLDQFASLRGRVMRGLAADPALFDSMLAAHAEEPSPALLAGAGARLGWRLLTT